MEKNRKKNENLYQVQTDMMGSANHDAHHGPSSQDRHLTRVKDNERMSKFHNGYTVTPMTPVMTPYLEYV